MIPFLVLLLLAGPAAAQPKPSRGAADKRQPTLADLEDMLQRLHEGAAKLQQVQSSADGVLAALGIAVSTPPASAQGAPVRPPAPNFTVAPAKTRNTLLLLKPDAAVQKTVAEKNKKKPAASKVKATVLTANADKSRNKIVVLDIWGTWCGPCRRAIPELDKIQKDYRAKGVVVVGISVGSPDKDFDAVASSVTYTVAKDDADDPVVDSYEVKGFPTLLVIDKEGRVVTREEGWGAQSAQAIRATLDALLKP